MKLHKNNNDEIIDVDPALEYPDIHTTNDSGDEDGSTI